MFPSTFFHSKLYKLKTSAMRNTALVSLHFCLCSLLLLNHSTAISIKSLNQNAVASNIGSGSTSSSWWWYWYPQSPSPSPSPSPSGQVHSPNNAPGPSPSSSTTSSSSSPRPWWYFRYDIFGPLPDGKTPPKYYYKYFFRWGDPAKILPSGNNALPTPSQNAGNDYSSWYRYGSGQNPYHRYGYRYGYPPNTPGVKGSPLPPPKA